MALPNIPIIENVGIYVRVSTEEQAEMGFSIEAQLEELNKQCKTEHKLVYKQYVDAGISGKSIDKRPALQELIQDAEKGLITEVWVWKTDRLSRRMADLMNLMELFNRHNVAFRSISEKDFDLSTSSGKAMMQIMGVMAEFQRNITVENVKLGMKQRARNGKWNGGQVLGYDVVKIPSTKGNRKGEDSELRVNPIEAELVRKIFSMYAGGRGLRSIANQLNHGGYLTKMKKPFSAVSVKTIITNPLYIGKIRYNVRENWSEKRRKGINPSPIIADGEHKPIISLEMWEAVQKLYSKKSVTSPRVFQGTYLLTGMMRCPDCNATLVAHRIHDTLKDGKRVVRRYYVCSAHRAKGRRVCTSNSVKADETEQYVIQRISQVVKKPKILEDIVTNINASRSTKVVPLQQEISVLDKELRTLNAQKQKYFSLYESETIGNAILIERLNELKSRHDALSKRKSEAERQLTLSTADPIPLDRVRQALSQFHRMLVSSPIETQKSLLQTIVKQIHVKKGKKIEGIELEFDEKVNACFLGLAPSTPAVEGAFVVSRQKFATAYTLTI